MGIDPVSLAVTVALNAATMAITASQTIEGPRLKDLSVTVADYGTPIPNFVGQRRIETPVFYAEPIQETKKKHKGKGGKYREYTYTGTFAVIVADHEIQDYLRIWFDHRLAYDSGSRRLTDALIDSGNLVGIGIAFMVSIFHGSKDIRNYVRFYYGTETQEPDERMQATVESEEGAGTCPAYLGVAYIMFEDLPLENFGNRFPLVSVEARRTSLPAYPWSEIAGASNGERIWCAKFDPGGTRFFVGVSGLFSIYNIVDVSLYSGGALTTNQNASRTVGWYEDGRIIYVSSDNNYLVTIDEFGTELSKENLFPTPDDQQQSVWVIKDGDDIEHWMTEPFSFVSCFYMDGVRFETGSFYGFEFQVADYTADQYGDIWAVGRRIGPFITTTTLRLFRVVDASGRVPSAGTFHSIPLEAGASGEAVAVGVCYNSAANQFVVRWRSKLYAIDDDDFTIKDSRSFDTDSYNTDKQFANLIYPASFLFTGQRAGIGSAEKIDLSDLSTVATYSMALWSAPDDADGIIYSQLENAFLTFGTASEEAFTCTIRYLRTIPDQLTLGDVASLISESVGLDASDYDFTDLDQIINGYSWIQGSGKAILDPLFTLYDSVARPNGFQIEGIKRGASVSGEVISYENFARTGSDDSEPFEIEVISESDLPRRIFLTYADLSAEQQANTAVAQRSSQSVVTVREVTHDLTTLALESDEAQQLCERTLRRFWMGSLRGTNKLPPNYLWQCPGDVIEMKFDDDDTRVRSMITRMNISPNRTITLRWEQDQAAIATVREVPLGAANGRPTPTIYNPQDTVLFILDIPLASDADDQTTPFLYVTGTPEMGGDWAGASVLTDSEIDGEFDTSFYLISSTSQSYAGICRAVLPDALSTVVDYKSTLIIRFYGDDPQFTSATLDELIADPTLNLVAVGDVERWELIQFMTADLQSDGEWIFSGLLRGLRGTERFTDTHQINDYFVAYNGAWALKNMGASKIGVTDYYKAVTYGLPETYRAAITETYGAETLRPLSVANVQIRKFYGSNDFQVTWQRRSRIGVSSIDGQDIPLGETSELYNVRVMNGSTAVRSVQVTSESFEYFSYEQIEDFGFELSSITVEVEQVSPALNLASATVSQSG